MKLSALLLALAAVASSQAADYPTPAGEEFTRSFPFSMVGRLYFANGDNHYIGSGTVIRPSSVLTAAHNLWDADNGFSTDILFQRSLYGKTDVSRQYAGRIYVLGGYRENARKFDAESVKTFSFDLAAVVFSTPVAGGSYAGWWANPSLLGPSTTMALGYGGEFHSGDELLRVAPVDGFQRITDTFYENYSAYFESGMSGGPIVAWDAEGKRYITGIVVASSDKPVAGGIRIIDSKAADFIRAYMK